ncbi:MAG: hypothetical protein F6J95_007205 [Leptolyngbya sp. SIO1E4]|nr:hypothetical protein [Leptolyngbya sp. SIO1E4]
MTDAVESLSVDTFATLRQEPATDKLIAGVIVESGKPPTVTPNLLIYREFHRTVNDGQTQWEARASHTPEFEVKIPGGLVTVTGNYRLEKTARATQAGDRRYEGFRADDEVLVVGKLVSQDEPFTLEAQVVTADTLER